ncbi:APC family permease [Caldanaerobacter sp.]|uniref:APC family permease n=1 Tax=Caldanaerobacter sp. TaxID=2930036 RepID=UPI003C78ABDC
MVEEKNKQELKRVLGTWDLVAFAIMTMVPIAPMGIYGVIAVVSHGHVPLAYTLAAVAMYFTAWGYAQFALRYPEAGSVYAYVRESVGFHAGFLAGWSILLDYILVPALVIMVSALWLEALTSISMIWWALLFIVLATFMNVLGIQLTSRAAWILFVFELFVLIAFIIVAIYKITTTPGLSFTLSPFYNPNDFSLHAVLAGTSIAVLSFLGFDIMTTLAEETIEARKNVSRAVRIVIPLVALMFVLQTYLGAVVHPGYEFADPDVAFFEITKEVGGNWLQMLAVLGTVLAWGIGDTMAAQAGISRVLFSMGRQGHLPKIFARIHPQYKTPYVATIFVALITGPLIYLLTLKDITSLVNFGALTSFIAMHLSLGYIFLTKERKPLAVIMPAIGFIVTAAVWWGLDKLAKELGFIWLILGFIYLAIITRGFRVKTTLPID